LLKKKKFLIGIIIICIAVGYLAVTAFMDSRRDYNTVSELVGSASSDVGRKVNVNGTVVGDTINYDVDTSTLTFTLTEGGRDLPVVFHGAAPDTFKPGADIVVAGQLDASGVFQADDIMTKCASKYAPQE
jgi:cytochrome c-type biogenesis protein CcmE